MEPAALIAPGEDHNEAGSMKRAKSRRPAAKRSKLQSLGESTKKVGMKVKRSATRMLRSLGDAANIMPSRPARRRGAR